MSEDRESPVRPYRVIQDSGNLNYVNRLLIGIPTTGLVRIEWHDACMGLMVPVNWSRVLMNQYINSYIALRYQVADAQNLIVRECVRRDFEWLLLYEHDVLPPPDAQVKLNRYIVEEKTPVVSGLYGTRSVPSDPLIFRGRGVGAYYDWNPGDRVWCDGVPTGFLLIHAAILREMWNDAPEYALGNQVTRRVFVTPRDIMFDATLNQFATLSGTSDLDWCTRVMKGGYLKRAGWPEYQDKEFPFLVDTSILCGHIESDGRIFYPEGKTNGKNP